MQKPIIGIPIGDPAGIGPEIVVKALTKSELYDICRPLVIGDLRVLENIEKIVGTGLKFNTLAEPSQGKYVYGTIDLVSLGNVDVSKLDYGRVQSIAGKAEYEYIVKSAQLANTGKITAIATAPINKEAIKAAGVVFVDHTEMYSSLSGTRDPITMFQVYNMRVFFFTRHVSLRKACDMVNRDRLADHLVRCDQALAKLGLEKRLIAVAGLNPHNGELGLYGSEEVNEIEPAVADAKERGVQVVGPIAADRVFSEALKGRYDAVVSLYHDQGIIATKTVDFIKTISLTIGMPFLRTSVDHGPAFEIAGTGTADPAGMEEAIRLAAVYGKSYGRDII